MAAPRIEALSDTSAGAMNAAVLADGHAERGAEGACAALERFRRRVSRAALLGPFRRGPLDVLLGRWTPDGSPAHLSMDFAARVFSPYDLKPAGANPLEGIVLETVDFARLARAPIRRFITATDVHTGRGRVFRDADPTPDAPLASVCLPTLFQAVAIEGRSYWGGGYAGNPTITPLVRERAADGTILVQVNPVERPETPRAARGILNRVNEVAFTATPLKESRMIAVLRRVADAGDCEGALGADARAPHRRRRGRGVRLLVQAERGVGVLVPAARRGAARGRRLQRRDVPAVHGDASSPDVLAQTGLQDARLLVVATPDPLEGHPIVRRANPGIEAVARSHDEAGRATSEAAGAARAPVAEHEPGRAMARAALKTYTSFIDRDDPIDGPGADYPTAWSVPEGGSEPLIEAGSVGRRGSTGLSPVGRGVLPGGTAAPVSAGR